MSGTTLGGGRNAIWPFLSLQESRPAALIVMLLHAYLSGDFAYVTCKRGRGVGVAKGTAIVVKGTAESPNRYSVGGKGWGIYGFRQGI